MTALVEAPADGVVITEPGVYEMSDTKYHADPVPGGSLSCSGARKMLSPSCPALYHHEREHGRPSKKTYDQGHAAHAKVLGVGADVVVVQANDWRTKAAQAARDEAYEAGKTPILQAEADAIDAMAEALLVNPIAAALFAPEHGKPEQSLFRRDERTGVMLRSRLDWLPEPRSTGRMIIPDYKTCRSAEPGAIAKSVAEYGYHCQGAWYVDMADALELASDIAFVFVFQEKTAPYLVTTAEVDVDAMRIGRHLNRTAIDLYARCEKTGTWPGYSDEVELVSLPPWVLNRYDMTELSS